MKAENKSDALPIFLTYSIIIGIASLVIVLARKDLAAKVSKLFDQVGLKTLLAIAALHFLAYVFHFHAIQKAINPGYANALIMFHVAVLTLLSWKFLNKPLSTRGVLGIAIMFVGAFVIVRSTSA